MQLILFDEFDFCLASSCCIHSFINGIVCIRFYPPNDLSYHIFIFCDEFDVASNIPVSTNFVIESSNVLKLQLSIPLLKYSMIYVVDIFEELTYQVSQVLSLKQCWPPNLAMKCNDLSVV